MKSDLEMLEIIHSGNYEEWINSMNPECANIIRTKIGEIPDVFFESRFSLDGNEKNSISLIEFCMRTSGMTAERRKGLMEKYHISPYDMNKLQGIINSMKVASEYGTDRQSDEVEEKLKKDDAYGIALANKNALEKAYPLWIAYLYSDSLNPLQDVKKRLETDGMADKYEPEYIVGLMNHTNSLMKGKSSSEKKDFYMHSISGILDEKSEVSISEEIEI